MSISKPTTSADLVVSDINIEIVRKDIKNLHLAVYPPDGHVRVAVPQKTTDDNVRLAVVSRLAWIRKQQESLAKQPRQSEREFVSGESHYFWGKRYLLEVIERRGKHEFVLKNNKKMRLTVNPNTSKTNRELVMNEWYRQQLKIRIPELLEKWQPKVGKQVNTWGVKKMKTKWGSCNIYAKRIWINLELAKKSPECLEYILVHELVHLHERCHNDRFRAKMGKVMPQWKLYKNILKSEPLGYEDWKY